MASRAPSEPFMLEVLFRRREDGGLQAECPKIPSFYLSHSDPELVIADVGPALSVILSEMYKTEVRVKPLRDFGAEMDEVPAAHICDAQRYVGLARQH